MSNVLPKSDFVKYLSDASGVSQAHVTAVLGALGPVIRTSTAEDYTVNLPGLGRFQEKERASRIGRNPRTGAEVEIAASRALTFKASKVSKS